MLDRAAFLDLMYECGGHISFMAEKCGVSRQSLYNWVAIYKLKPDLAKAREVFRVNRDNKIVEAVRRAKGKMNKACKLLGLSDDKGIHDYINSRPGLAKRVYEVRQKFKDEQKIARTVVNDAIKRGILEYRVKRKHKKKKPISD